MQMPGRKYSLPNSNYRYGFNGMEKDNDIEGETYSTEFRIFNSRIGRWLSIDPLESKFPDYSPYHAMNNNPIKIIDPEGLEGKNSTDKNNQNGNYSKPNLKLKFGWAVLRILWPRWWGKAGMNRMQGYFNCHPFSNPFKEPKGAREKKEITLLFVDEKVRYDNPIIPPPVASATQPLVAPGTATTNTYTLNPSDTYQIQYDMRSLPDAMTVTDQNGTVIGTTGLVTSTGAITIPPGTRAISVTVTPGPSPATRYSYQVLQTSGRITEHRKRLLWGFIPIKKTKEVVNFNVNRPGDYAPTTNNKVWTGLTIRF
jgi:RHS repeat-associated protein